LSPAGEAAGKRWYSLGTIVVSVVQGVGSAGYRAGDFGGSGEGKLSNVRKGSLREAECQRVLQNMGYITWKTIRHRFHNIDLFGLFDVVAADPDGHHLLFIQVKTNRCDRKTRERIKALKLPPGCYKFIWTWKKRKGWERELVA